MSERRRFPRLQKPMDGTWDGAAGTGHGRVTDLGMGGCFIDARTPAGVGQRLAVTLSSPDSPPVRVDAEVVYVDTVAGFAVRFVDVAAETQEALASFLARAGLERPRGGTA